MVLLIGPKSDRFSYLFVFFFFMGGNVRQKLQLKIVRNFLILKLDCIMMQKEKKTAKSVNYWAFYVILVPEIIWHFFVASFTLKEEM